MSFARQVQAFAVKSEKALDQTVRAITFSLFREVVQRTPVLDGFLKGSWQVTVGSPASANVMRADPTGNGVISQIVANAGGFGTTTYMTTLMPYAQRIEYDGWSHTKAPAGMVRIAFARIETIVANAARANKV